MTRPDTFTRTPEAAADYEWANRPDPEPPEHADPTPLPADPKLAQIIRHVTEQAHRDRMEQAALHQAEVDASLARMEAARQAQDACEDGMTARGWAKARTAERWSA